jgi:hypothetical protein
MQSSIKPHHDCTNTKRFTYSDLATWSISFRNLTYVLSHHIRLYSLFELKKRNNPNSCDGFQCHAHFQVLQHSISLQMQNVWTIVVVNISILTCTISNSPMLGKCYRMIRAYSTVTFVLPY